MKVKIIKKYSENLVDYSIKQTSFAERLKQAMKLKNYRQVDLANKSGMDKGIISSYLSGKYKAKQDNIHILAEALGVNEAWLMGYDLKMTFEDEINEFIKDKKIIDIKYQYNDIESVLILYED